MIETGASSWTGIRVRRGEKYGTVTRDSNGFWRRVLTVTMDDNDTAYITMFNTSEDDPEEAHEWEWFWEKNEDKKWYRF